MRIGFVSRAPSAAAASFYWHGLSATGLARRVNRGDHAAMAACDALLFTDYPGDVDDLLACKALLPGTPCGLLDPHSREAVGNVARFDFLVVDSIEMRDYWAMAGKPVCEYLEYPHVPVRKPSATSTGEPTIIGYHGNTVHLNCMADTVSPALEELADRYPLELWVVYNFRRQSAWTRGVPRNLVVRHIDWHPGVYAEELAAVDIGIVPAFMPVAPEPEGAARTDARDLSRLLQYRCDDYRLRFKMTSNPGRIVVWAFLGKPVVADFFPSAAHCIEDGDSGLLACSQPGWRVALERLITDRRMRLASGQRLQERMVAKYGFATQNRRLVEFLRLHFAR